MREGIPGADWEKDSEDISEFIPDIHSNSGPVSALRKKLVICIAGNFFTINKSDKLIISYCKR